MFFSSVNTVKMSRLTTKRFQIVQTIVQFGKPTLHFVQFKVDIIVHCAGSWFQNFSDRAHFLLSGCGYNYVTRLRRQADLKRLGTQDSSCYFRNTPPAIRKSGRKLDFQNALPTSKPWVVYVYALNSF